MSVLLEKISRSTLMRRSLSISLISCSAVILLALAPLWIPILWVLDLLRGTSGLRCIAFIQVFLIMELLGLLALLATWCVSPLLSDQAYMQANFRIQVWWGSTLFECARRLFNLHSEIEGQELARQAPHVLLPRHASFADTAFACALISRPYGIRHRYALKRELLWDPCIDVAGQRLKCIFLDRGTGRGAEEARRLADACADLDTNEGVLIYPEGTRYSAVKRERRLAVLARHQPEALPVAEALRNVLYPHITGTYAAFESAGFPDALFLAHTGFEHSASFASLWQGRMQGQRVQLRFWRIASEHVPRERVAFSEWLIDQWQHMDEQLDAMKSGTVALKADADEPKAERQSNMEGRA